MSGDTLKDIIEKNGRDADYAWKVWWDHKWFKPPAGQSHEEAYLPLKDYYPAIPYPPDEEWDYGGNDRWDVYLGQFTGGVLGIYDYAAYIIVPNDSL